MYLLSLNNTIFTHISRYFNLILCIWNIYIYISPPEESERLGKMAVEAHGVKIFL